MTMREQINDRIEAYAKTVRDRRADVVSQLFAERFDHIVHGVGTDPANPWNTKKETDREGIRRIYEAFFSNVAEMAVEYTDRTIDVESNSVAMVVRVSVGSVSWKTPFTSGGMIKERSCASTAGMGNLQIRELD